jgi:hypothetical protein
VPVTDVPEWSLTTAKFKPLVIVIGQSCKGALHLVGKWKTDHYEIDNTNIDDLRCTAGDRWPLTIYVTSSKNVAAHSAVSNGDFTWNYDNQE